MDLESLISQYSSYIIIGITTVLVILIIINIVQGVKIKKIKKKYQLFMVGKDAMSLEEQIVGQFAEIEEIKDQLAKSSEQMKTISDALANTYQKMGIVKYDAFKEMGGKLSFTLALLDDNNNGFIINSMHSSREGCYTYVKEIIRGESFVILSEEEKEALDIAINKKNYME